MIKKTYLLAGIIAATLCSASVAHAQTSRLYFAGYLGLSTFSDMEFSESSTSSNGDLQADNATSFAGALGIRLNRNIRLEGELSYRNSDFSTINIDGSGSFTAGGELKSSLAFLNVYYDFDVPWKVQPFIGAGLGYGWHSGEIVDSSGTSANTSADASGLAWNVGGGLRYRTQDNFAFTGSYRFVDSLDLDLGGYDIDYGAHEFRVGMEWDLPVR
jgi:OOP family OmpA-OmpF porin